MVPVEPPVVAHAAAAPVVPACAEPRQPAVALARRLHDTVVQRLAGLSYLLAADDGGMTADEREHCRAEIGAALAELRDTLQMAAGPERRPADEAEALDAELAALWRAHPGVQVDWRDPGEVLAGGAPAAVVACLAEGLRNARKHAAPANVHVALACDAELLTVTVANDGAGVEGGRGCGMGLRLLEIEASLLGGLVESRADATEGWWRLRLILPATG